MSILYLPRGRFATAQEWLTYCYSCGREKFYWNVQKEQGVCHRCKVTVIGITTLKKRYELVAAKPPLAGTGGLSIPPTNIVRAHLDTTAVQYLHTRYMSLEDISESNLWYADGHLYCPIDPLSPEYVPGWVKRSISAGGGWSVLPNTPKKYYAYGWEKVGTSSKAAFVEGVFDAIPARLGIPTVACLGSSISQPLVDALEASNIKVAYLAFDPDEPGRAATRHFKREAETLGIKTVDLKLKVEMGDMGPLHPVMRKWRGKLSEKD